MSKLTFEMQTAPDHSWKCHLECGQCDAMTRAGAQCTRRVCFGYPTCWQHTITQYGVQIRPSNINGAGKGLFAKRNFAQGEWICPHGGQTTLDHACVHDRRYPGDDVTAPYVVTTEDGHMQDAACSRGIGSMANGQFRNNGRPEPINLHNTRLVTRDDLNNQEAVWLQATRNINQGSEILVHYGLAYILEDNHGTTRKRGNDTRPC